MRTALGALVLVLLAACGFQLRGTAALPFESIHLPGSGDIALELRRSIQSGSRTAVVDDPKRAQALLEVLREERQKEILSLTADGRVREFRLFYHVEFRVHDGRGGEYVRPAALQVWRDMTYSDAQLLAKESEEQLQYRDMQQDMVQQIMRRMAAAQPPRPAGR
jgi:LPS-assembly lipoprotein